MQLLKQVRERLGRFEREKRGLSHSFVPADIAGLPGKTAGV